MFWQGLGRGSSEASAGHPAHVVVERGGGVECMYAAVARDVAHIVVVADVAGGIAPSSDCVSLAVEAGLRAERGIFFELLAAVVGVELEGVVEVSDEAAGGVLGLEGEAGAVAEAGTDCPAGLLLQSGGADRRDDLSVDGGAGVCNVACRAAGCGGPQRDRGTDGEPWATVQRCSGVSGGYNVGLHRVLGGVGRIAGGHHAFVEGALGAHAIVAADAENDGALFAHRVVPRHTWTHTTVVRRQ